MDEKEIKEIRKEIDAKTRDKDIREQAFKFVTENNIEIDKAIKKATDKFQQLKKPVKVKKKKQKMVEVIYIKGPSSGFKTKYNVNIANIYRERGLVKFV